MWWIRQLSSPLNYLRIRVGKGYYKSKKFYDVVLPIICTLLTVGTLFFLPKTPTIFGSNGVLDALQSLVTQLIAFFVAALAAVATFNHPPLNTKMDGSDVYIWKREPSNGESQRHTLTRRQYICYLFGYLAFISFFIFLFIVSGKLMSQSIKDMTSFEVGLSLKWIYVSILSFWFWNMSVSFLLGLFFLTDRLHR